MAEPQMRAMTHSFTTQKHNTTLHYTPQKPTKITEIVGVFLTNRRTNKRETTLITILRVLLNEFASYHPAAAQ